MKKHWKVLSTIILAAAIATACGTDEVDEKVSGGNHTSNETPSENNNEEVINEEMIAADLEFSDGYYTFTLKNISDKDIELTFNSTQEYEYQIKDSGGNVVYTYSMDKMFLQTVVEKTIAPNKEIAMNVDLDVFSKLDSGTYTLTIWSVALDTENLSDSVEVTIEEAASDIEGEYVGQIDNNSVEIKDASGTPKAYRLTTGTTELINSLKTGEKVSYSYYKHNNQLFLTMVSAIQ